jgi:hypothetical protein
MNGFLSLYLWNENELGCCNTQAREIRSSPSTKKPTVVISGSPCRLHEMRNLGKKKSPDILHLRASLERFGLQPEGHAHANQSPSIDPPDRVRAVRVWPHDLSAVLQRSR